MNKEDKYILMLKLETIETWANTIHGNVESGVDMSELLWRMEQLTKMSKDLLELTHKLAEDE